MTRKDYELIAAALARANFTATRESLSAKTVALVSYELADSLAKDNPRFQRGKFLAACGVAVPT